MKKIINPTIQKTYGGRGYRTYIEITYKEGKLSLHGVQGPLSSGNCLGSCGQIQDHLLKDVSRFTKGWNRGTVKKLQAIWKRYHLNDMKAGTPEQETFIREWVKTNRYDYKKACDALKEVGLYEIDGHKYGTKWLFEAVPDDVIQWLFSLPSAENRPAWV